MKWKDLRFILIMVMFVGIALGFPVYMIIKESIIENRIVEEAVRGNIYAIKILKRRENPWKLNTLLLEEGLKGNPNALLVIGIEEKEK